MYEKKNFYTVYKHTSPSGKVYIGITGKKVEERWEYGYGYRKQVFGKAIKNMVGIILNMKF